MIGFLEDVHGARMEPLAGVTLVLFDDRCEGEQESLRRGCPLRMFALQCRTGTCKLEVFGMRLALEPGDTCVVSCAQGEEARCSLRLSKDFSGSLLGLSRREMPEVTRQTLRAFDVDVTTFERVAQQGPMVRLVRRERALDHAYALLYTLPAHSARGLVRLRTIELAYVFSRVSWKSSEGRKVRKPSHEEIARRAAEVMTRDLSHPLTIPATAQLCGTSTTVLKQAFRETFDQSVHEWYRASRMRYAAQLLESTSYSVAQISSEVGYSNPSKFSKVFAAHLGSTPSVWRASHRSLKNDEGSASPYGVEHTTR